MNRAAPVSFRIVTDIRTRQAPQTLAPLLLDRLTGNESIMPPLGPSEAHPEELARVMDVLEEEEHHEEEVADENPVDEAPGTGVGAHHPGCWPL